MIMALITVALVAVAAAGWASNRDSDSGSAPTSALQILDQRLARGELSAPEYAERRTVLLADKARRRLAPWAIVGIGLATVLVVLTFGGGWRSMDSGWMDTGWMGGHMGWGSTAVTTAPFADAREIVVEAGELWFEPDRIEVTAGEGVNLRVTNNGEAFHDLTVPAADLVIDVEPGDEALGGLQLDEPGTYEFFCSVPGHADAGMQGIVAVTS